MKKSLVALSLLLCTSVSANNFEEQDISLLSQVGYIGGNTHVYEYKLSSYGFAESYVSLRKICRGVK